MYNIIIFEDWRNLNDFIIISIYILLSCLFINYNPKDIYWDNEELLFLYSRFKIETNDSSVKFPRLIIDERT